jgi:hypothetical protein
MPEAGQRVVVVRSALRDGHRTMRLVSEAQVDLARERSALAARA